MQHLPVKGGLPLKGIKVIDLSKLYPGPLCTLCLSDMGATVIRVEEENKPELLRVLPPHFEGSASSTEDNDECSGSVAFHSLNRGKLSVTLDLKKKEGRESLFKLLENGAHVLVESFRSGVLEKLLGLGDIQELHRRFPRLIIARISPFGNHNTLPNDYKRIPAHDMNSLAMSGAFHLSSVKPHPLPIQVVDLLTGWSSCAQICAALLKLQKEGKGSIIDISMYDNAVASMIMPASITLSTNEKISGGKDFLVGSIPSYNMYKTKDGYLSVGCLEIHFWNMFVSKIGLSKYKGIHHANCQDSVQCHKIMMEIESKLLEKTSTEWENEFAKKAGLPILAVRYPEDLRNDPILEQRHMIANLSSNNQSHTSPELKVLKPALDYTSFLKDGSSHHCKCAPQLGIHNEQILSKL